MKTGRQIIDRQNRVAAASRGVSVSYGVTGDLPRFADAVRQLGEKTARKGL